MPVIRHRKLIGAFALFLILAVSVWVFLGIGRWLVVEDPLERADAIVVLSGGLPYRAIEAAKIFREGYAPEIWVSHPIGPGQELEAMGIHYVGEESYSRDVLLHEGVPPASIQVFQSTIVDTEEEIREISEALRRRGKTRVIMVTSPPHTRRVKTLWHRMVGAPPHAIVRAAFEDPYDAAHWWRKTGDALSVVRETLGLLNAWAGRPVRPQGR